MTDVQPQEEQWKTAWIEFMIEMVALDPTSESPNGSNKSDSVMQVAAEIERSIKES